MRRVLTLVVLMGTSALVWVGCGSSASPSAASTVSRRIPVIGFNDNAVAQGLVSPATDAGLEAETYANTVRVTLNWAGIERTQGDFDFSGPDALYAAMAARGIKVLWIPMFAPRWAAGSNCPTLSTTVCHAPPTPSHYNDWEIFITKIVQRYPDSAGIEVWNEPNEMAFWQPHPNPAQYVQLLNFAHQAVKSVNPSMRVISGGIGDTPPSASGDISFDSFLRSMFNDDAAPYMDALGVHPYPYGSDESTFVAAMADVQSILTQYGQSGMPVWITEMGVSTTGPNAVSPSAQASELTDLYHRAEAIPNVQAVFLHTLLDPPGTSGNPEVGFGIFANPQAPKPAQPAVAQVFEADQGLPSSTEAARPRSRSRGELSRARRRRAHRRARRG